VRHWTTSQNQIVPVSSSVKQVATILLAIPSGSKSALAAGYQGNLKLEEHYVNGRLKTVTGFMGADYCSLLNA
jgi:hypothetical protein